MKIEIPPHVASIIGILEEAGYEAYAVGGCVRDTLLGRVPEDWDITTSARPEQVKRHFRRTVDTGIQHGTVTVLMGKCGYEVTTYRLDGEYEDGRHPKDVTFTASLREDLRRRDFTINAMAYSDKSGIIDEFHGMDDLKSGIIRCVGSAEERFTEDALRILRAVRFSAQLGFSIEEETSRAIQKMASRLELISRERIQAELDKLLCSPHPEYFRKAYELGITAVVIPEFDRAMETPQRNLYHRLSVGEHTLRTLENIRVDHILRWTMLLHDLGKPQVRSEDEQGNIHFYHHAEAGAEIARKIIRRLKFDNATLDAVTTLVTYHDFPFPISKEGVREALNRVGRDLFPLLLEVCTADSMGKNEYAREMYLPKLLQVQEYYKEILESGDCVSLSELAIKGGDLIGAGMKPGKKLGECLQRCLESVLECPERNTKEYLLDFAVQIWNEKTTSESEFHE
ncbi:HD domain-containing protein [Lacrimispora sp. NSJ-141]|uniref:HD domain-containing protein n=1 Tax=Lientehia hominis TaxID=2897778 RepID=A0AAP2W7E2_9FIRM|nr:HD domain-containing protein [Lientehia hominis]MCD2492328.1 HD domain-containing protein [Lientehia hominis]